MQWSKGCLPHKLGFFPPDYELSPVYTIQPVVKQVWQPVECLHTWYNRLSNPLSKGLTTGCIVYTNIQPVVKPVWQPVRQTAVSCIQPVVKPVVQPGLTTGWTNSHCLFNTVVKPVWQPAVLCIQTFNRLSIRFDNQLDVCLQDTAGCHTDCTTGCIV